MNNKNKLFKVVAEVFNVKLNSIDMNTNSNNIKNWDSLGMINLITEIEKTFNIKFDILEIPLLHSIKIIIEKLEKKGIMF
jgi:acyl carrier protein|tara:strand:- start:719 stop:958 length:240 start_codon:yes stop_codon:yes gene_type:complete